MKAKELAEQLLKYPDFYVEFDVCTTIPTYDHPWPEYTTFEVNGISEIAHGSQVIVLEVDKLG